MLDQDARTADERRDQSYHADHAARAIKVIRRLNAAGKRVRPADAQRCQDYAIEVLRHRAYVPWLMVYSALAGEFKEGWIPDNFYGSRVVHAIQGPPGHVSFLKSLSAALFDSPSFPDLGSRINGSLFDRAYRPLAFDDAHEQFFERNDQIVFKPDDSGRGRDIAFFDKGSFDRATVEALGNGVFQRYVSQHPFFDQFSNASVATIRITTVVEDGGPISVRAGHLRLGSGSDTHILPASQVSVPLDLASGAPRETGLLSWLECRAHPTSGEPFAGKTIPAFEQCLSTALSHHQRIPFVRCIGWDMAVDIDDEPQILEWNGFHNSIILAEALQGPCFKGLGWERFA